MAPNAGRDFRIVKIFTEDPDCALNNSFKIVPSTYVFIMNKEHHVKYVSPPKDKDKVTDHEEFLCSFVKNKT